MRARAHTHTCSPLSFNLTDTSDIDYKTVYIACMQVSGEFPISSQAYGDQTLPSTLHKRVHPYDPVSEPGQ